MRYKFVLKHRPKKYLITESQMVFKEALQYCGIEKGITKKQLMEAMKLCIPQFYKEKRDGEN